MSDENWDEEVTPIVQSKFQNSSKFENNKENSAVRTEANYGNVNKSNSSQYGQTEQNYRKPYGSNFDSKSEANQKDVKSSYQPLSSFSKCSISNPNNYLANKDQENFDDDTPAPQPPASKREEEIKVQQPYVNKFRSSQQDAWEEEEKPRGSYPSKNQGFENREEQNYNEGEKTNDYKRDSTKYGEVGQERPPPYIPEAPSNEEQDIFAKTISEGIDFDRYKSIKVQISGGDGLQETILKFDQVSGLNKAILENIRRCQFTTPTPIQQFCIPVIGRGKYDLMGCAQTGSGKTAAFLVPTLSYLLNNNLALGNPSLISPHILVVGPTRELVTQIWGDMRKFAHNTPIQTGVVYGGVGLRYLMNNMKNGCDCLAATPGRLLELVNRGLVCLKNVKFLILDEADRMLDMGFINDIRKIIYDYGMPPSEKCRCYMFSATFPVEIQKLAGEILAKDYYFLRVGIVGGAADSIIQEILSVPPQEKRNHLMDIIKRVDAHKVLVFVETKRGADFLTTFLCLNDINATSIHGDRTQEQREMALSGFKKGLNPVLIATSVAARGLDIPQVELVVNFDLPAEIDEYVHRIGRTGRLGNKGLAISFFTPGKDDSLTGPLLTILTNSKQTIPEFLQDGDYSSNAGGTRKFVHSKDHREISRRSVKAYASHHEQDDQNGFTPAVVDQDGENWE